MKSERGQGETANGRRGERCVSAAFEDEDDDEDEYEVLPARLLSSLVAGETASGEPAL